MNPMLLQIFLVPVFEKVFAHALIMPIKRA